MIDFENWTAAKALSASKMVFLEWAAVASAWRPSQSRAVLLPDIPGRGKSTLAAVQGAWTSSFATGSPPNRLLDDLRAATRRLN